MSISELQARFHGYRRHEEEQEEAKLVEHNRNVSELFSSRCEEGYSFAAVRQNMKLYEKRVNDTVLSILDSVRWVKNGRW